MFKWAPSRNGFPRAQRGCPDAAKAMIADIAAACGAAVATDWMLVSSFLKRGQ